MALREAKRLRPLEDEASVASDEDVGSSVGGVTVVPFMAGGGRGRASTQGERARAAEKRSTARVDAISSSQRPSRLFFLLTFNCSPGPGSSDAASASVSHQTLALSFVGLAPHLGAPREAHLPTC